jgi:UDP-N-acetylglucosamine 2-epimerase
VFPRWVHEHRDRRLLRLPAGKLLALEALRLAPSDPWTYLSGSADVIAVESDRMERHYLREGLPPERLVRTGALYDDVLARNRSAALENRRAVLKDAGLTDDKPLVLCALPPDQFTCIRPGREFASQRELLEFMVETFRSVAANVVYRLHPRTRAEEMEFLRALGAPIIDRDTAELVPLCDVFVASVSATIRWAIACGKPVINYDMHRYRYHDFDEAGGVVTIEDKADFPRVVRDVVANRATYAARQAAVAPDWATLDGNAGARMAQLFDRVAKEPR